MTLHPSYKRFGDLRLKVTYSFYTRFLQKRRAKRVLAKPETQLLCELESLEPIVQWLEGEDAEIDSLDNIPEFRIDVTIPIINDSHERLALPFANLDSFVI